MHFETLIEHYHDEIYRYLWRLLSGSADGALSAEDLTQEVFLRAYRAFERLPAESNYRAWLYRVATNCAYTALKRGRRLAQHTSAWDVASLADTAPSPYQQAAINETLGALRGAIARLPPKQQAALILRYLQELPYADIAQALGCSEESARAHVYQALQRLRHDLTEEEEDERAG